MRILALNCGSSSIKSALIDTRTGARLLDVRILDPDTPACRLLIREGDAESSEGLAVDFVAGVQRVIDETLKRSARLGAPQAVAHRVVHGGARFRQPALLDDATFAAIRDLQPLAPLHNPPALEAIGQARATLADLPHVAVFDTAFHSTLPARAQHYALPADLRERLGIRRYGFHGTSHAHVMRAVAAHLRADPQQLRIVSCHLGNGASVTAIEYGRSVETSMGMTPLEGLVMGTRCGDIDAGVLLHLLRNGYDVGQLDTLLNEQCGLMAFAGTNDLREVERRAAGGDEACRLAITLYAHRARKYIGAYAAVMGGVDAIAFTGGIGENSALMRHRILQRLDFLGARLDEDRNRDARVGAGTPLVAIAEETSRVALCVVRCDEEVSIATAAAGALRPAQDTGGLRIPIAISARHAHLSRATLDRLFGPGYALQPRTALFQPGQFAAQETVALIGPRGRLEHVRLMGPVRDQDQIEISRRDEFVLGIDAPVRISGDVANSPGITIEGPLGRTTLASGVICARRHIHMSPGDAERFGVSDHDVVSVAIDTDGRDLVFADVAVRVSPQFRLEMHLDTDEANAAGLSRGDTGELLAPTAAQARISSGRAG